MYWVRGEEGRGGGEGGGKEEGKGRGEGRGGEGRGGGEGGEGRGGRGGEGRGGEMKGGGKEEGKGRGLSSSNHDCCRYIKASTIFRKCQLFVISNSVGTMCCCYLLECQQTTQLYSRDYLGSECLHI